MATLIKPPKPAGDVKDVVGSVFLAGSIEQDKVSKWQDRVWQALKDIPSLGVLNPRRDNWDASWKQEIDDKNFNEQVTWELLGLENVDMVAMYFDPSTKSPITLCELGLLSNRFTVFTPRTVVCCPKGFYRKGNVDIVCKRYGHKMVETLEDLIEEIKTEFKYLHELGKDFDSKNCSIGWSKAK